MDGMQISKILKEARKFAKTAWAGEKHDIKIAVLGSCSIQYFVLLLRYYLFQNGITADIYEGEYNGIAMDVLDADSRLYSFAPDAVIILPDYRDIKAYPKLLCDEDASQLCAGFIDGYKKIWAALTNHLPGITVLQGNFVLPLESPLGNLEANYKFSRRSFIRRINGELLNVRLANVVLVDMEYLASALGKRTWFDNSQYFLTKMPCRLECLWDLAELFAKQILALKGKVRKCLVLDLDNTLWGGVVSEEGCDGINLDPNNAVGESYLAFQQYLLSLKERGVILAVCSKNDEEVAKEPFAKNRYMKLKLTDIACFVANWEDKASNIKRIAKELNIGLDSMVFFDDNPAEREVVRQFLSMVEVIEVPEDPSDYVTALDDAMAFEWTQLTKEDIARNQSYIAETQRREMADSFVDYDDYLKALDMRARIGVVLDNQAARFSQLINKSNQFNLRTQRYSEQAIAEYIKSDDVKCISAELKDKFSDYGLISCVILRRVGSVCFIDTWVMSCRVLKRGLEYMMFERILSAAREWDCRAVVGEYIPTAKNGMVKDLYETLGFVPAESVEGIHKTTDDSVLYSFDTAVEPSKKYYILAE